MAGRPPFGDDETALLTVPLPRMLALIAGLGGAAVALLSLGLSPWTRDAEMRLTLLALAALMSFYAVRGSGIRLHLHGDGFELHWLFGGAKCSADEFLGYKSGFVAHTYLLRREDLKWVELPTLTGSERLEDDLERWLGTFVPTLDVRRVRAVRRGSELPRGVARLLLERSLPGEPPDGFYGSARDIDLARAARAVERHRYADARESLEALVPRLPEWSVATPFVFDALRAVGNASSAAALERALDRYGPRPRAHLARALCELATEAQRATLERLLKNGDHFVSRQARRALARLDSGSRGPT